MSWAAFGALNEIEFPAHAVPTTIAGVPTPLAPMPGPPAAPVVPFEGVADGDAVGEVWGIGEAAPPPGWAPDACAVRLPEIRLAATDWIWAPAKCRMPRPASATAPTRIARRVKRPISGRCSSAPCIRTGAASAAWAVTWNAHCFGSANHAIC